MDVLLALVVVVVVMMRIVSSCAGMEWMFLTNVIGLCRVLVCFFGGLAWGWKCVYVNVSTRI